MFRQKQSIALIVTTVSLLVLISGVALAKKPPKDPPPDPDPAPVRYRVFWVDSVTPPDVTVSAFSARLDDINDELQGVGVTSWDDADGGHSRALIVKIHDGETPSVEAEVLDSLLDEDTLPDKWLYTTSASVINNAGCIVGKFKRIDGTRGTFTCETVAAPPYPVYEVPINGSIQDINEHGDILLRVSSGGQGVVALKMSQNEYQFVSLPQELNVGNGGINNLCEVVGYIGDAVKGPGCVYSMAEGTLTILESACPTPTRRRINDNGVVAHALGARKKIYLARYILESSSGEVLFTSHLSGALDINTFGQISAANWPNNDNGGGLIYDPSGGGKVWELNDLVYAPSAEDEDYWFLGDAFGSRCYPIAMTNRDSSLPITGFPVLCGKKDGYKGSGDRAFVLLPQPPDTP